MNLARASCTSRFEGVVNNELKYMISGWERSGTSARKYANLAERLRDMDSTPLLVVSVGGKVILTVSRRHRVLVCWL